MKKLVMILALLVVVGAVPGWCLVATVDNTIDAHTKDSGFRPVQDAGALYAKVDHEIGAGMDKVPVLQDRSKLISPIDKMLHDSIDGVKSLINGTWDLLTFKSMREKDVVKK